MYSNTFSQIDTRLDSRRVCAMAAGLLFVVGLAHAAEPNAVKFDWVMISSEANMWWARALGDINGDGLLDIVLQDENAHGGQLGWFECQDKGRIWLPQVIATTAPMGATFASGDLDVGDVDNDGDLDVLGFKHTGEWDGAAMPTEILWYENPRWQYHRIGRVADFVKDVSLVDFNLDGKLDLVTITYEQNELSIFRQDEPTLWAHVQEIRIDNLHEGMDVGDIDGDRDPDIATNGYWLANPGNDLRGEWKLRTIDEKWHTQSGDWSKNATKVYCQDITGDGKDEVFISHSERAGYPVSWYHADDPNEGPWTEHVIVDEMPAAHTLQVFDADGDGDFDVLTGVNATRARDLHIDKWPAVIFLNGGDNETWKPFELSDQGIYNGQVADFDLDGDRDIFCIPAHDGADFMLLINQRAR